MALSPELKAKIMQQAKQIDKVETEMKNRIANSGAGASSVQPVSSPTVAPIISRLDNPINSPSVTKTINTQSAQIADRLNSGTYAANTGRQAAIVQQAKDYKSAQAAANLDNSLMGQATRDENVRRLNSAMEGLYARMEGYRNNGQTEELARSERQYQLLGDRLAENKAAGGSLEDASKWEQRQYDRIIQAGGEELMEQLGQLARLKATVDQENQANQFSEILKAPSKAWYEYQQRVAALREQYGDEAADWLAYAERIQNASDSQALNQKLQQAGKDMPVLTSGLSVGTNLISGLGTLDVAAQRLGKAITGSDIPIDYNRAAQRPAQVTSNIRQGVSEDMGGVGRFLYNTGMSMLDSASVMASGGAGMALLGGAAATSAMQEAVQRGATDDQALLTGLVAGGMEAVMEKASIDSLFDLKTAKNAKDVVLNILKQSGAEGTEEALTTIANTIADAIIMGDESQLETRKRELEAQGYSEQQAERMAMKEWGQSLALDAAGGALSGGVFGSIKTGVDGIMPKLQQSRQATGEKQAAKMVQDLTGQNKNAPVNETGADSNIPLLLPEQSEITKQRGYPYERKDAVYKVVEIPQEKVAEIEAYINTVNSAEARKKYKRILKNLFSGQKFTNANTVANEIAYEIGIGSKGIGEIIARQPVNAQTLAMLEQLNEIVENAKYVASEPTSHPERSAVKRTDIFETDTRIGDQLGKAKMRVNVTNQGNTLYFATNKTAETQSPQPRDGITEHRGVEETASATNNSIPVSPENVNGGNVGDMGAKTSQFRHEVKESQSKTTPHYYEKYNIPEEGRADNQYTVVHEDESMNNARVRLEQDYDGEVSELRNKTTWSNEEMDMGQMVLDDLRKKAEASGDWSEFREWDRVNREHKTEAGRSLQALAKQNRDTATGIISNATDALETAKKGTDVDDVLNTVSDYAGQYEAAVKSKDVDSMVQIIRDTSVARQTGTLRHNQLSKQMNWALDRIAGYAKAELSAPQPSGDYEVGQYYDFLKNFTASGIEAIATDKQKVGAGQAYLTIRRNAMLSKASTIMRNLVGNNVFDPLDSVATNMSVPLDLLLSKFTGTRSTAVDKSWVSSAKRKGSMDGLAMALLEVGLDVNAEGADSKYESKSSRTFHMANGPVSKMLSQWEKYMGYALNVTDEIQKGGIAAEAQRGIDRLYEQGKIKDESLRNAGEQEALYRTFQDDTIPARVTKGIRGALNQIRTKNGKVGAGDILIPFAQVPANLPARAVDYSPVGLTRGVVKMATALHDAKKGTMTAAQQASAVKDIGRGLTGTGMIAAAAALASKGIIHVVAPGGEDENKDKAASEGAQGLRDTQWNLSATIRAASGKSTEWQDGDIVMSIAFLDPINAQLTTGALIAEDAMNGEADVGNILLDSLEGAVQSFLDLPVMQTFRDVANAYQYSDAETDAGKALDAGTQLLASELTSAIPNSLKGIAQGTDKYQRDLYTKDDLFGRTMDQVIASIPGLRQTLPTKQDVYGNDVKNPAQPLNFLNSNILPGAITTYTETDLEKALNDLANQTGVNTVYLSKTPPKSITVDGEKVELTTDQQRKFMSDRGDLYEATSAALENSETYQGFSNEWKLKAYEYAEDFTNQMAKDGLGAGFEPDTWVSDLEGATQEELAAAMLQRVVENMAGKAGGNKYLGLETLLEERSIDDQMALACMSDSCYTAYTEQCEKAGISVQQFLDAYGTATASGDTATEKKQAALDYIQTMDISAEQKGALASAVQTAIGTFAPVETQVSDQWLLDVGDTDRIKEQMSKEQLEKYETYIEHSNVRMQTYLDMMEYYGSDEAKAKKDKDGDTIEGEGLKDHMIDYISGLKIPDDQKDALYCSLYSEKTLPRHW